MYNFQRGDFCYQKSQFKSQYSYQERRKWGKKRGRKRRVGKEGSGKERRGERKIMRKEEEEYI